MTSNFFRLFFGLPTYPCPILSWYRHPILVYSVWFWQTYLPTQKSVIIYGRLLKNRSIFHFDNVNIVFFENACGFKLDFEIVGKRPGDIPEIFSDPTLAKSLLGWKAKYDINKMCLDAWNWQKQNPNGFS